MSYEPKYAFHESDSLWDEMDPVFEETLARALDEWPGTREVVFSVPVNMSEEEDQIRVRVEVPGVQPDSVQVRIEGRVLKVEGALDFDQPASRLFPSYLHERDCGRFRRMVALPSNTDSSRMRTELRNGVLNIQLPKVA